MAKKQDNGSYKWAYYAKDGSSIDNGILTYNKWGLASKTAESEGQFSRKLEFTLPAPGTYTYDVKGNLTEHVKKSDSKRYAYNDKGDQTKESKKVYKDWSAVNFYENYVYDDHGNWISRTKGYDAGKPTIIEKRVIVYADSKEDLAQKATALIQAVEPIVMNVK